MATQPVSQVLQEAYLLATGKTASAAKLAQFESLVSSGNYAQIGREIDSAMGALSKSIGAIATLQTIAQNGMDMTLNDRQAADLIDAMKAKGVDSWSKLFNYCIDLQTDDGKLLDNKAQAAISFNTKVAALGKTALVNSQQVDAAVQEILLGIDATAGSLATAIESLDGLAAGLLPGGFRMKLADGYIAGATVFIDANGDGILNEGEFSTTTDSKGDFVIPDGVQAGAIVGYGGTDVLTGLAFKGTLSAPAGSTVINPLTTAYFHGAAKSGPKFGVKGTAKNNKLTFEKALGIKNVGSYDPLAVLLDPNASASQKQLALNAQKSAVQLGNVMTQVTAMLSAADPGRSANELAAYVQDYMVVFLKANIRLDGKRVDFADQALLTRFLRDIFSDSGVQTASDAASQLARIMATENAAVERARNLEGISKAAKIAQGEVLDSMVNGVRTGSFTTTDILYTDDSINTKVNGTTVPPSPETPAPTPAPAPEPAPAPATFTAAVAAGGISFAGTATGNITLSWAGTSGASVATFTRATIVATTTADFAGAVTFATLSSGQVLSATLADISSVNIQGAGGLVVTGSTTGDDTLTVGGNIANVTWDALGGNDKLVLNTGNTGNYTLTGVETIEGGTGADNVVLVNTVSTLAFDGKGDNDRLTLANGGNTVTLTLTDVETLYGGTGADAITLATAVTGLSVDGKGGTDSLTLANAVNSVTVTNVATITGGTQADTITVTGATGATINGGGGADIITGGAGNDTITGGAGNDTINLASGGADIVILDSAGIDTINGFDASSGDKIQLSKTIFASLGAAGALTAAEYGEAAGGAATTAAQRIILDTNNGNLYYDSNGSGAGGVNQIAKLTGVTTLTAAAFEIVGSAPVIET